MKIFIKLKNELAEIVASNIKEDLEDIIMKELNHPFKKDLKDMILKELNPLVKECITQTHLKDLIESTVKQELQMTLLLSEELGKVKRLHTMLFQDINKIKTMLGIN